MSTSGMPPDPRFAHLPPPPQWTMPTTPTPGYFAPPPPQERGAARGTAANRRIEIDVRNFVLGLGVACLAAAAVSFVAVSWESFNASMRAGLLVGATVAALVARALLRRRGLLGTAMALSWLVAVLLFVDLFAVRKASFPDVALDGFTAIGGMVLFAGFLLLDAVEDDQAMRTGAMVAWVMGSWAALAYWDVTGPDVWVLPLAAVVGWFHWGYARRNPSKGSWERLGATLLVLAVPSVITALADPNALRPLIVITAATLVLLAGMWFRQLAAVWVGGVSIAMLAAGQLVDVLHGVPGWAVFALVGLVLLAVGACFEYRLRLAARSGSDDTTDVGTPGESDQGGAEFGDRTPAWQ